MRLSEARALLCRFVLWMIVNSVLKHAFKRGEGIVVYVCSFRNLYVLMIYGKILDATCFEVCLRMYVFMYMYMYVCMHAYTYVYPCYVFVCLFIMTNLDQIRR